MIPKPEVFYERVDPALGVPAPGEGARLPEDGVEEQGLPHGHVRAEVDVLLHEGYPPVKALGATP